MAISAGGGRSGVRNEINITPLIDVLLVLLIIFMVITPLLQQGYATHLPPKVESAVPPPAQSDQLIVRIDASGNMFINKTQVPASTFVTELQNALKGREKKLVFFAADGELPYSKVADFLDSVRNAGAENLGMVFDDLKPGG
ncbi:MAG: biopolymer transporter ExbD [Thermoanaerobaculia bacterium]